MNLNKANILITGGSEGIGLGLATRLLTAGSNVLITGRNEEKLTTAALRFSGLQIFKSDVGIATEREQLALHISKAMPGINVIINNAGFQRRISLAEDKAPWSERQAEIDALFSGPVHLNHLLIPLMLSHGQAALIVNVTSGGAYIPQVFAPVYSASKAALHSYTVILRHSLSDTSIGVAELIPPAVQTNLAGPGLNHGAAIDEFCDAVFKGLFIDDLKEVGFGPTVNLIPELSGKPVDELFAASSARFVMGKYRGE